MIVGRFAKHYNRGVEQDAVARRGEQHGQMTYFEPPRRRPRQRHGSRGWIHIDNPLHLAFAVLAVAIVLCIVASTCLKPY